MVRYRTVQYSIVQHSTISYSVVQPTGTTKFFSGWPECRSLLRLAGVHLFSKEALRAPRTYGPHRGLGTSGVPGIPGLGWSSGHTRVTKYTRAAVVPGFGVCPSPRIGTRIWGHIMFARLYFSSIRCCSAIEAARLYFSSIAHLPSQRPLSRCSRRIQLRETILVSKPE